jgi:hypothetical protein
MVLLSNRDEDTDGDINDKLDDEEQAKFDEKKRKAIEREAKEAAEDIADAPLEESVVDVEAVIEYIPTFTILCFISDPVPSAEIKKAFTQLSSSLFMGSGTSAMVPSPFFTHWVTQSLGTSLTGSMSKAFV